MEILPLELWELIFSFFKDKLLANTVPLICRFARDLTHPNSKIWQEKCLAIDTSATISEHVTWKRCYYSARFRLFPLMGHVIGEATIEQLQKSPGYTHTETLYDNRSMLTIKEHSFWTKRSGIFTVFNSSRGKELPKPWKNFGFKWSTSWLQYKQLLKRWNGNYEVKVAPTKRKNEEDKPFRARITSVARHSATVYYIIDLGFDKRNGSEDSSDTLCRISLVSPKNFKEEPDLKSIYEAQLIVDTPKDAPQLY